MYFFQSCSNLQRGMGPVHIILKSKSRIPEPSILLLFFIFLIPIKQPHKTNDQFINNASQNLKIYPSQKIEPLQISQILQMSLPNHSSFLSPTIIIILVFALCFLTLWASLVAQTVKSLPVMQGIWVQFLGLEDPLEKGRATHPIILAGELHGQRSLAGYSSWFHKELDRPE